MKAQQIVLAAVCGCVLAYTNVNLSVLGQSAGRSNDSKVAGANGYYFSKEFSADRSDGLTMKQQALATLKRLETNIKTAGFGLPDVVFVRAYLAPASDNRVDYAGWDQAWDEVFRDVKNKPTRTTIAVPLAGEAGRLIQLECITATSDSAKSEDGMYWTAGMTAPVVDSKVPASSSESRGDMFTQSRNTLRRLKDNLEQAGLSLSDVISVRAFLGPDKTGKIDYESWNRAYDEFLGNNAVPHRPAVVAATSPAFPGAGALIEIEFVAAFPASTALFNAPGASSHPRLRDFGEPSAMISSGVAVKPQTRFYFSGAAVPTVTGDMKTQALSALESLRRQLAEAGASFQDVVFVRAYVPSADGKFDLAGWQEAYATFFNTPAQPHKSARTTIAVSALANPEWKIAVDAVAVVP